MGIDIFKKIMNAMKSVGNKIKDFASKTIKALPKVVNTGKKIINAVKPAIQFIPGLVMLSTRWTLVWEWLIHLLENLLGNH